MKLLVPVMLAAGSPAAGLALAVSEQSGLAAILAALLGGGGLLGILKLWTTLQDRREERADKRLEAVLSAHRDEREKDRVKDREGRERTEARHAAALATVAKAIDTQTSEIRGLRKDHADGRHGCRVPHVPGG